MRLTCIYCPIGCTLDVSIRDHRVEVKGNRCPRGCEYAEKEVLDPRRILFTVVRIDTKDYRIGAVRSKKPIPKIRIKDILEELKGIKIPESAKIGDIVATIDGFEFILTRK